MNNENVLLRMEGITKEFPGVKALDGVNLTVRAGTVHALMGENGAGKSTLMKCLFGVYKKDSGHIYLEGKEIDFKNSKEALENGVAMVHQELNQALKRSVMDNIWLGRYPTFGGLFVSEKKMLADTRAIFDELGVSVSYAYKVIQRLNNELKEKLKKVTSALSKLKERLKKLQKKGTDEKKLNVFRGGLKNGKKFC